MSLLSFHTNAFVWVGLNDIETIASFALNNGFSAIELGPGIELDEKVFSRIVSKLPMSAMIYCRNFIDDDESLATAEKKELWRRMSFASSIGSKKMIISTGISRKLSLPPEGGCNPLLSLDKVLCFLEEAVTRADKLGLDLLIENCPMYRNIATSPYMWREIFSHLDADNLGLCYDPSHFVWQMIDVYKPLIEFMPRIKHVHVKNTVIRRDKLNDVGILHNTARDRGYEENQWWFHSLLDEGEIDWKKLLETFGNNKLPDLSFEMEDYRYQDSVESVKTGLIKQVDYLKRIEKEI